MDWRMICVLSTTLLCITGQGEDNTTISSTRKPNDFSLTDAVNEFGYKLTVKMMTDNENKNVVLSPTGVAGLLAMMLLGSVGTTYDELADTLGFSQDILTNRKNHEEYGQLLHMLNGNSTYSKTLYADAVFVEPHTQLRGIYQDYLKMVYEAETLSTDFRNVTKAKEIINEWVRNHTEGKIENFVKKSLSPDTRLVLANALYFSGQWLRPFIPEHTRRLPFETPSEQVMVDLMLNMGTFNYLYSVDEGFQMAALPYNDSVSVMYVMKPRRKSLLELLESLTYAKIDNFISKLTEKRVILRFPKMKLSCDLDLRKSLESIGVKSIFDPLEANFALMVENSGQLNATQEELITRLDEGNLGSLSYKLKTLPNPGISVSSLLHEVMITINEFGTEAVAASAGVLARSAELMYLDSPFYIFIRNEVTKLVTFNAVIYNPS